MWYSRFYKEMHKNTRVSVRLNTHKSFIRTHLEHCEQIQAPRFKEGYHNIEEIEEDIYKNSIGDDRP